MEFARLYEKGNRFTVTGIQLLPQEILRKLKGRVKGNISHFVIKRLLTTHHCVSSKLLRGYKRRKNMCMSFQIDF